MTCRINTEVSAGKLWWFPLPCVEVHVPMHAQGFQVMVDQQSGFGRVAADLLLALRDDYGATPSLLFGLQSGPAPLRNGQVLAHTAGSSSGYRSYRYRAWASPVVCPGPKPSQFISS